MKKLFVLMVILTAALSTASLAAGSVSGFNIYPVCEHDGSVSIKVRSSLDTDVYTKDLSFKFIFEEGKFTKVSPLSGGWKEQVISPNREIYFRAPKDSLTYQGSYTFILEEENCDRVSCSTKQAVQCLGALHETFCDAKPKFEIKSCGLEDGRFHAVVTKVAEGYLSEIPIESFDYTFYGDKTNYDFRNVPSDLKLTKTEEDTYDFSFAPVGRIEKAQIRSKVCSETSFLDCTDAVEETEQVVKKAVEESLETVEEALAPEEMMETESQETQEKTPQVSEPSNDTTARVVIIIFFIALILFIGVKIFKMVKKEE